MAQSPEQKKSYQVVKSFKALNTKANRTALQDDEFSWLENVQPIGFGNLKVVPTSSNVAYANTVSVSWSNTVSSLTSVNIKNVDYVLAFQQNGGAQYFNLANLTIGTLANAGTFSGTGVRARQWKNERTIIIDPANGYYTWDTANLITVGCISSVGVTFQGSHYTSAPDVTISSPNQANGVQAIAFASISNASGTISSIQVTAAGSGYTTIPTITIAPPSSQFGTQATASAVLSSNTVVGISITNPGSGYTSIPSVTISGGSGSGAAASAVLGSGFLNSIVVFDPGTGYTSAPTITFTGGLPSPVNLANVAKTSNVVTINTSSAHGLATGEIVNVTSNVANISANSVTVTVTSNIAFTYPLTGANIATTVSTGNVSYTPATAIAGYVTFATGTIGIVLEKGGQGYTSAPIVNITGGGGANAAATAIVNGNTVTQIIVTNAGTGYTSDPAISFSGGGGGSGATALGFATTKSNIDIASFQSRVWVAQGRTVFYSAAGSYNDFITASAGNLPLNDDTLHSDITALISANNFLYVFGEDSINVFSDVRVDTAGQTIFTNTNVSASVGSKRIDAIYPYFRSLLFMNDYGVYALVGATTTKLSDSLDGIYPYIDFTKPVSGGQVLINNILCAAFNFYYNGPVGSARWVQAVFFDKKWFLTSQGNIQKLTFVPTAGGLFLYGTNQTNLIKLYSDTANNISSTVQTALWPLGDIIRTKQALKFGVEATLNIPATLNATVDSETSSSPVYTFNNLIGWVNNSGVSVLWTNNTSAVIGWIGGTGYNLYKSDAQQYGKYLGLTLTSNTAGFTYNTFELEHELRARF